MDTSGKRNYILLPPTLGNKLGTLLISFFVLLIAVALLQPVVLSLCTDQRDAFLISSSLQCLLAFIAPSLLTAYLCSPSVSEYVGATSDVAPRQFAGVIVLMIIMLPALNMIVGWNADLQLPEFMSGLEQTFRTWEENAARTTEMILGDTSLFGLISGILIVGCLTGLAEEMFFRAGLQKALTSSGVNHHLAIWTAAFIFSAVHFQFFGFVPRLLLGGLFGYLYCYTGSIWIAATAHALNNSLVVLSAWLTARGAVNVRFDEIGTGGEYGWLFALVSAVLTTGFIIYLWKIFFRRPQQTGASAKA